MAGLGGAGDGMGTGGGTALLLQLVDLAQSAFVLVVNEVAPRTIGTESDSVESAAQFRFVLGVASQTSQLVTSVGELALVSVLAVSVFFEGSAQLGLVSGGVDISGILQVLLLLARHLCQGSSFWVYSNWFGYTAV